MRVAVKSVNSLPRTRLARSIQGLEGDPSWTRRGPRPEPVLDPHGNPQNARRACELKAGTPVNVNLCPSSHPTPLCNTVNCRQDIASSCDVVFKHCSGKTGTKSASKCLKPPTQRAARASLIWAWRYESRWLCLGVTRADPISLLTAPRPLPHHCHPTFLETTTTPARVMLAKLNACLC
jgi:hypothetical protein